MSHCRNTLNFIQNFRENSTQAFVEGEMGVYGIAVLSFFSNGISVVLILTSGIAVSSSPACGFSSFCLTLFGKRGSFTVLRNCSLCSLVYCKSVFSRLD